MTLAQAIIKNPNAPIKQQGWFFHVGKKKFLATKKNHDTIADLHYAGHLRSTWHDGKHWETR
jgi:hypothetical protein